MASKYECEIRFFIPEIRKFTKRLRELKAKMLYSYEFSDHYYEPTNAKPWDPLNQTLRLRKWVKKSEEKKLESEVLFTKNEVIEKNNLLFKRAVYPQGKIQLFKSNYERCKQLLEDLGFTEWFTIEKKKCKFYEIVSPKFFTVQEFIEGLGWTGEIEVEGSNIVEASKKLNDFLKALHVERSQISFKPLGKIYAERLGLFKK